MVHQHGDHHDIPSHSRLKRIGGWLPTDHRIHHEWLGRIIDHAHKRHGPAEKVKLIPVLQEFQDLIENNARIYMYFNQMWDEVPRRAPYNKDPTGKSQIRDYKHMLAILNEVFGRAPEWTDAAAHAGMVGVPMAAIFDYAMGTPSGHAAFLDPDVNKMLKKVLNEWGKYLKSPESAQVLGDHSAGWFGETGYEDLMEVANTPRETSFKFEEMYQCDPSKKYYGFTSWDDFFTRKITDHSRPVASPEDDNVIVNSCESRPYCVAKDVKLRDKFWVKGQPYSIVDMLAHDPLSKHFSGGTIYQAFLSALSYHRWHSPVSGTIKRAFVEDGTYFSEPLMYEQAGGEGKVDIDIKGIQGALGYLTSLATRAIIFIEADNPKIGLCAFVGVGMDEVSTCDITVKEGQKVKKGEELGMFHFGGSTYCLLFRKETKLKGWPDIGGYMERNVNFPVREKVAVVEG